MRLARALSIRGHRMLAMGRLDRSPSGSLIHFVLGACLELRRGGDVSGERPFHWTHQAVDHGQLRQAARLASPAVAKRAAAILDTQANPATKSAERFGMRDRP